MNWYAKAIDVLENESTDFRALAFELAKKNPKALVMAAQKFEPGWKDRCRVLMISGEKIAAIKEWRNNTGDGLAESKAACETLIA